MIYSHLFFHDIQIIVKKKNDNFIICMYILNNTITVAILAQVGIFVLPTGFSNGFQ